MFLNTELHPSNAAAGNDPQSGLAAVPWSERVAAFSHRHRRVLFAFVLLVYLCSFNGQWQPWPDSGLYLTLGRNLALGRGYVYRGVSHGLAYPGLPYALAAIFKLFPNHAIAIADGFMIACGLATIACLYHLVCLAVDRPSAVVVALNVAVSREFFRYNFEILTDLPFLLGTMLFLLGHEIIFRDRDRDDAPRKRGWALLLLGLILAISTRPTVIGLLLVWGLYILGCLIYRPQSRPTALRAAAIVAGIAIALVFVDPRRMAPSGWRDSYEISVLHDFTQKTVGQVCQNIGANLADLFGLTAARSLVGMPMGPTVLNFIFGSISLIAGLALFRRRTLWGMWVAITLLMLILIQSHDRYMLQILPLLFLGWWLMIRGLNRRFPTTAGNWLFLALFLVGTLANLEQIGSIAVAQHRRPFLEHFRGGMYWPYDQISSPLAQNTTAEDVIICPPTFGRMLTFWTDRNVYESGEPLAAKPGGPPPMIVLDPDKPNFVQWLADQHLELTGPVLAGIPRTTGSPLLLQRAVLAR